MPKPPKPTDSNFAKFPEAEPVHVAIVAAKVVTKEIPQAFRKAGGPTERDVVKLTFEAVPGAKDSEGNDLDGARAYDQPGFTLSNHPKARLRPLFLAVMSKDPADDEELYEKADTDKLPGKQLTVIAEYPTQQDGKKSQYAKVSIVKRLAKAKWVADSITKKMVEDYEAKAAEKAAKSTAQDAEADAAASDPDEGGLDDF